MADMKNLIVGNTTYNIYDDKAFRIGGNARETSAFYANDSSPYTCNLQLKRINDTNTLNLAVQDDGYLKLSTVDVVNDQEDWSTIDDVWNVDMRKLSSTNTRNVSSATVSSSYSGTCYYVKIGHIVIVSAIIATTGAISNNTTLATGLPASLETNVPFPAQDNSAGSGYSHIVVVNSSGELKFRGTTAGTAASRSLRITGAYLS